MFWCYVCGEGKANVTTFRDHINRHANDYQLTRPIRCCQGGCKSTFMQTFNFFRHVRSFHSHDDSCNASSQQLLQNSQPVETNVYAEQRDCELSLCTSNGSIGDNEVGLNAILSEGTSLVASMRANSSVPYSLIPQVVQSINEVSTRLVSACHAEAVRCFASVTDAKSSSDSVKIFDTCLSSSLLKLREPLGFLGSKYKQDAYFSSQESYVSPLSINFGLRFEMRRGKTKTVYDTFEYVPISETVRVLLHNEQYMHKLIQVQMTNSDSNVISHYFDGRSAKDRFPQSETGKLSIFVQLFYDGMGTTNPLRGQSVMCNVGVFYYVIQNLPDSWNSCFPNVHLLALCYEQDLKVHGFGPILDKFVSEMSVLSSVGLQGVFPVIGEATVRVHLSNVVCDNLALNSMLGFIESFSGDYFCTMCYATRSSMQSGFSEECFQRRNREEYDKDVESLKCLPGTSCHVRGVKRYCELNNLQGFHVTDNNTMDIMHTVLEGVVPVEVGCVLHCLVMEKRLFTLDDLNDMINNFWGLITVDRNKKPPHLNRLLPPGNGLSPSMKATQCWALLKYMPLIIGDKVPSGDKHYRLLLHLSELVDQVFAPRFTQGSVAYMKEFIKDHLVMFVELFGEQVNLKPKHHFLVHLPTVVLKSGPLVGMSCLKYELKNSFFKRSSHIVCNFINICKTHAFRHQNFALYSLLSNAHMRECIVVGSSTCTPVSSVLQGSVTLLLCEVLGVKPDDDVVLTNSLKRGTYDYRKGHHFVTDIVDDEHIFGAVECFVCRPDEEKWHMLIRVFDTLGYIDHFHSYAVRERSPLTYRLLTFHDLCDHHAVCSYTKLYNGSRIQLLRLPYCMFQ